MKSLMPDWTVAMQCISIKMCLERICQKLLENRPIVDSNPQFSSSNSVYDNRLLVAGGGFEPPTFGL